GSCSAARCAELISAPGGRPTHSSVALLEPGQERLPTRALVDKPRLSSELVQFVLESVPSLGGDHDGDGPASLGDHRGFLAQGAHSSFKLSRKAVLGTVLNLMSLGRLPFPWNVRLDARSPV